MLEDLLIASQVVLWVAVLVLAVSVFALSRQLARLFARVPPAGALSVNTLLQPGDLAPRIDATDIWGKSLTVGGEGLSQRLLFFLSLDCPICKSLIPVVRSVCASEQAELLLISDGAEIEDHRSFAEQCDLALYRYVRSEAVGMQYAVGKLPYAVLLTPSGVVASLGIVNNREHLESLFVAKEAGVGTVQQYVQELGQDAQ